MSQLVEMEFQSLDALAAALADEHRAAETSYRGALEHAVRAGQLLTAAKAQLKHGEWLGWLAENFDGTDRAASGYMRLARAHEQDRKSISDLGVADALQALATPKPETPQSPQQVGDSLRDHGQSTAGALAKLDDDEPAPAPFPAPGMQQRTWRQINSELDHCRRTMESATQPQSDWARAEEIHAAARRAREASTMLTELAATLR